MTTSSRAGTFREVAPRARVREILLLGSVLVLAVVVGRSLAGGQLALAGIVAGAALVAVLAQATWLPYVAAATLVGSFAEASSLPQFALPGNPFLSDLVLFGAVAAWLLVLSRADMPKPSSFPVEPQLAVAAMLVGSLVGVMVGSRNGIPLTDALRNSRELMYYVLFWLALTALADARGRRIVFRLAVGIAIVVVVAQVVQGFLGPGTLLFYSHDPLRELITCPSSQCADPTAGGFPRVRPPGLALVYVTACFSAAYLLFGPARRRVHVGALLGLCSLGIMVSLNRNMVIGLVAGIGLAGLVAVRRGRFAVGLGVAALLTVGLLAAVQGSPSLRGSTIAERVLSLTTVSQLESSSTVTDRLRENSFALDALRSAPIEGLGWGVPYGMRVAVWTDGELRTEEPLFLHNQYLNVWLRAGLLGLIGLLAALALSVSYGTRWLRERKDEDDAWLGAGVIAAVTALAFSSVVGIYVLNVASASILAGLFALATVLRRELDLLA